MYFSTKSLQVVAIAIFVFGAIGVFAQPASDSAAAKEKARKGSAPAADLQKLVEQVNSQREKMIADHDALAKQLKDATDEQRKAILDKMHEQKKDFEAAQSALHKQIRDDQRRQRQNAAPGKR